jgi:hypothetical protein
MEEHQLIEGLKQNKRLFGTRPCCGGDFHLGGSRQEGSVVKRFFFHKTQPLLGPK